MKTLLSNSIVALIAIALPALAIGQETGTGAGTSTGSTGATANGSAVTGLSNSAALFALLDTNKDGKLSPEEFARITAVAPIATPAPAAPRTGSGASSPETGTGAGTSTGATGGSGGTPNAR